MTARERWPMVWVWRCLLPERCGTFCRIVHRQADLGSVQGGAGTVTVEFELDGYSTAAPRKAMRRRPEPRPKNPAAVSLGRSGGIAFASKLSPEARTLIGMRLAAARWGRT